MIEIIPKKGWHIEDACRVAVRVARGGRQAVSMLFNAVKMKITPEDTVESAVEQFWAKSGMVVNGKWQG